MSQCNIMIFLNILHTSKAKVLHLWLSDKDSLEFVIRCSGASHLEVCTHLPENRKFDCNKAHIVVCLFVCLIFLKEKQETTLTTYVLFEFP